jgi:hypothetical protein
VADAVIPAPIEGVNQEEEKTTSHRSNRKRFGTAVVLIVVFLVLLALSAWLYPRRGVVNRPAPFALTMISAAGPNVGAFDIIPLTVVANQAYTNPSEVNVVVAPVGRDLYAVHIKWTYSPALCSDGQDRVEAEGMGCGPTSPPYEVAGSEVSVSLPVGATISHCHSCQSGSQPSLAERDSTIRPNPGLPDASVLTTTTPAFPVTASWNFEIHDTAFAWAANGVTAEASLPVINFQNNGNTGYGNVTVTYRIPGGNNYDWNDGPDPDHLSWTEPVGAVSTAVQVSGTNNSAANSDTRNALIVGILLGTAGGALVGAIQELAHAESDGRRGRSKPVVTG